MGGGVALRRGAGVGLLVFLFLNAVCGTTKGARPKRSSSFGAHSASGRCDFSAFLIKSEKTDKGLYVNILEAKIEAAAGGIYTSPPTFRFYI